MKSELLFYAQVGMYAGHRSGLPAFPLAARCDKGSEYAHEDCWAATLDPEEFFGLLELSNAPSPGLWMVTAEYQADDVEEQDEEESAWLHLIGGQLTPCGPEQFREISEQVHEREQQEEKEFPSTKWRWL